MFMMVVLTRATSAMMLMCVFMFAFMFAFMFVMMMSHCYVLIN